MITFSIDLLVIIIIFSSFKNIKYGFLLSLICRILFPSYVSFVLGPISISIHYITTAALTVSLLFNYRRMGKLPNDIKRYVLLYSLSTFILILLSSGFVPIGYQLQAFVKGFIFLTMLYIVEAKFIISVLSSNTIIKTIGWLSIIIGIYGIVSYLMSLNVYITLLSLNYGRDDMFAYFLEEERGGIVGRAYGTTGHPLSWGQYWNIILAFIIVVKNKLNKYFFIVLSAIGIINIVLSGSRTAIVALIVMLLFTCVAYGIKRIVIAVVFLYVGSVISINVIPQTYLDNDVVKYIESAVFFWDSSKSDEAGIQGSSTGMRYNQLEESIEIANKNPIGGIGYQAEYYAIQSKQQIGRNLYGLESFIFKILVEQGYVGLIVFLYLYNLIRNYALNQCSLRKQRILTNGYCFSFLTSITFTGIQGNSYIYFIIFLFFIVQINDTKDNTLLLAK